MTMTKAPVKRVANHEAIRAIREAMGYNTTQFAALVGISQPYMSRIETGECPGTPRVWRGIAEALHVPVGAITTVRQPIDAS